MTIAEACASDSEGQAVTDYDAVEYSIDGRQELGYLKLLRGEKLYKFSGPEPGHHNNLILVVNKY